jgi:uncharacterized phage protein (TIGR02218 family)
VTTRPGRLAEDLLRYHRGKHLAHCLRVVPKDGTEILVTDHDRPLTVESRTYLPVSLGGLSADRREGGFRSGDQDVRAVIDGATITLPDLQQQRYRGADVFVTIVDWCKPAVIFARHRRVITRITFDGSTFVGTMESVSHQIKRPTGGRFGGYFTRVCQYEFAGVHCQKQIAAETVTGASVGTVPDEYMTVRWTTGSFSPPSNAQVDNFYKDGSIVWTTGDNVGQVSPIYQFDWATRECRLLIPTLQPIQIGDEATVKPGCDGLFTTCKDKWGNQNNFGGSDLEPSASNIREPVIDS